MQIRKLLDEERAVSPVIGVILMVAITVILAAVIGTFVLGLGDQVNDQAPQASIQFEYSPSSSPPEISVTHAGGDSLTQSQINVKVGNQATKSAADWDSGSDGKIVAGDSMTVGSSGSPDVSISSAPSTGDAVRIIWKSPSGGDTATIAQGTYSA